MMVDQKFPLVDLVKSEEELKQRLGMDNSQVYSKSLFLYILSRSCLKILRRKPKEATGRMRGKVHKAFSLFGSPIQRNSELCRPRAPRSTYSVLLQLVEIHGGQLQQMVKRAPRNLHLTCFLAKNYE